MQVSGSAIGRVFTQPVAPPRRFRGAIDAALTLALGSVCAFALTLGPAPLNTVAVSSAAAASFAGHFDPAPEAALLPAEVDDSDGSSSGSNSEQGEPSTSGATVDEGPTTQTPAESSTKAISPGAAKKAEKSQQPKVLGPPPHASAPGPPPHASAPGPPPHASVPGPPPHAQNVPGPPQGVTGAAAMTVVEMFRMASGLSAFVPADACAQPTVHASVTVGANGSLSPAQAHKSLAPDPAYATVGIGPGTLSVTVYSCE